jgi:anti-anti-sigma regulatory factor
MPGNLQTTYDGDVVIFRLWIDLMSGGGTLQEAIARSLDKGYRKFVLDLKKIPRLGMGDVSLIISAWSSINAKSGEMALVMVPNESLGLIDQMRLTSLLATYSTLEAAVKSFGRSSRSVSG